MSYEFKFTCRKGGKRVQNLGHNCCVLNDVLSLGQAYLGSSFYSHRLPDFTHLLINSKLYTEDLLFESKDISGLNIELLIIWDYNIFV